MFRLFDAIIAFNVRCVLAVLLLLGLLLVPGCEEVDQSAAFQPDESGTVIMVVMDLSPSFQHHMVDDGAAYDFVMHALHAYHDSRIGSKDRLLLAQISGTRKSVMFDGSPEELRDRYPTAEDFRRFLAEKARPNGSLVHLATAHALEYMMTLENVASRKAKSVVLVISDMEDNGPKPVESEERLMKAFTDYMHLGGAIGLYYCDQLQMVKWRKKFRDAGFTMYAIETDPRGKPALPKLVY